MPFFKKQKFAPTLAEQQQETYIQYPPFENKLMVETGGAFVLGSAYGGVTGTLKEVVIASIGEHDTLTNSVSRVLNRGGSYGSSVAAWWLTYRGFEIAIKTSQLRVDDDTVSVLAAACTGAVHDGLTGGFTGALVGGVSTGLMFATLNCLRNKLSKKYLGFFQTETL